MKVLRIIGVIFFSIGLMIYLAGFTFKIMHWPYANEMLIVAPVLFGPGIIMTVITFVFPYRKP